MELRHLLVALAACSHGGSSRSDATSPPSPSTRTSAAARRARRLTIGSVDVQRSGKSGSVGATTRKSVLESAQRYVDTAILAPLATGKVGVGYGAVFTPGIRPAATGPDLRALTEVGVGKTKTFDESSTPVAVSALADQLGILLYVSTTFRVKVVATVATGTMTIDRRVELTLEPIGRSWLVSAYRTTVKRTAPKRARKATTTTRPSHPRTTTTVRKPHKKKSP